MITPVLLFSCNSRYERRTPRHTENNYFKYDSPRNYGYEEVKRKTERAKYTQRDRERDTESERHTDLEL